MPHGRKTGRRGNALTTPPPGKTVAFRAPFSETAAWAATGEGWNQLFGSFRHLGFSFEWHDFVPAREFDWSRSFHPGGLELCLNLNGHATIQAGDQRVDLAPRTFTFYFQGEPPLRATRRGAERHRFVTVEFTREFLAGSFAAQSEKLDALIRAVALGDSQTSTVAAVQRLATPHLKLAESLRQCPVYQPAQALWFRAKALELAAHLFFRPVDGELFCTRAQRLARERVERAQAILREQHVNPPSLEELGKQVGCSPFYLSRLFSQEAGVTIQQFIRQLRMEEAAELLRTGRCNVTEAAFAVGYNSLSHFSTAFHDTFGCCPGLYPLKTLTQKAAPH